MAKSFISGPNEGWKDTPWTRLRHLTLEVGNGYKPARRIVTGAGALEVREPRVRDNSPNKHERVQFSSAILPPYLRRSKAIEEFIPWLYLKEISTGDFS